MMAYLHQNPVPNVVTVKIILTMENAESTKTTVVQVNST